MELKDIRALLGETVPHGEEPAFRVSGVAYRSDAVTDGDAFFCIPGFRHDGHEFAEDAAALEAFFDEHDTVYSDMDMAHSSAEYPEHAVDYADITTHADEMRGWLRFDTWGISIEGGRLLDDDSIELSLGPTIDDRVRFAPDRETLR